LSVVITFAFADQFAFQGTFAARDVGAGDECEDAEVLKALQLVTCTRDPVFAFGGVQCFRPRRIIARIADRFKRAVLECGENLIERECGRDVKGKEVMCFAKWGKFRKKSVGMIIWWQIIYESKGVFGKGGQAWRTGGMNTSRRCCRIRKGG
jgi:hypothetical protein